MVDKTLMQIKRNLNKILSDFANAYENLPEDMSNTTALKLSSILETAFDRIIATTEPYYIEKGRQMEREGIQELLRKEYHVVSKGHTDSAINDVIRRLSQALKGGKDV